MKTLGRLFFLSLCMAIISLAQAQSLNTYTFPSGATAEYPATWSVMRYETGREYLTSEDSIVNLFDPPSLQELDITSTDFIEAMTAFFPLWDYSDGLTFDAAQVQITTLGTRSIARYDFYDAYGDEAMLVALRFSDGAVGVVVGLTYGGELTEREQILAIAASFDYPGSKVGIGGAIDGATRGNAGIVGDNVESIPTTWVEKTFGDGTRLSYDPTAWEVSRDEDDALTLSTESINITIFIYYARTLNARRLDTLEKVAEYDFSNVGFEDFYDAALGEQTTVSGFEGLAYTYTVETEDDHYQAYSLYLPFPNGAVMRARAIAMTGFDLPDLAPLESLLGTLSPSNAVEDVRPLAEADTSLTQAHTIDGIDFDMLINLPEMWDVNVNDDGYTWFSSDYTLFYPGWLSPAEQAERGIVAGDLVAAIESFFAPNDETLTVNTATIKVQTVNGAQVARYDYVDTDDNGSYTSTILAAQINDGWIFLAEFFPRLGEQTPEPQAALNVFLSAKVVLQ